MPRRVGGVRGVGATAGQVPEDPCVDGRQGELGRRVDPAVVEQPAHLRGAEVGVEQETGAGADEREVSRIGDRPAVRRGPAVLPDDGAVQRAARAPVPGDDGLPLVGDPEGLCHAAVFLETSRDLGKGGTDRRPDLVGVVLDPPGTGEVLGELAVGDVDDPCVGVDDEGTNPGGARVDGDGDRRGGAHGWTVPRRRAAGLGGVGRSGIGAKKVVDRDVITLL